MMNSRGFKMAFLTSNRYHQHWDFCFISESGLLVLHILLPSPSRIAHFFDSILSGPKGFLLTETTLYPLALDRRLGEPIDPKTISEDCLQIIKTSSAHEAACQIGHDATVILAQSVEATIGSRFEVTPSCIGFPLFENLFGLLC